jgi:hypothetical protein
MMFAVTIASTLLLALGVRYAMWEYAPHSGKGAPPMFGDFEAQRHWVEITNALPVNEWYVESSRNNLSYWGLDYPPLTAFHSYYIGVLARQYLQRRFGMADGNRRWELSYGLRTSRGSEHPQTVSLMRYSALWSEIAVFVSACAFFVRTLYNLRLRRCSGSPRLLNGLRTSVPFALGTLLVWGSLSMVYVDHGHFQFNAVSLGLFVWSCNMLLLDCLATAGLGPSGTFRYLGLSIVFYVASYCFKQMSLYYCLGFAAIFFSRCIMVIREKKRIAWLVASLSFCLFVGVGSMLLAFFPFIQTGTHMHVLQRVFPVNRGLFEDKVANVWCCLSLIWKMPLTMRKLLGAEVSEENVQRAVFYVCAFVTVVSSNLAVVGAITASFDAKVTREAKPSTQNDHDHGHDHAHGPCSSHSGAPIPAELSVAEEEAALASFVAKLWALLASSLSFYLFSFQVHEKSILLPMMPVALLLAFFSLVPWADPSLGLSSWLWCFLLFSHLSLSQLAEKDHSISAFLVSGVPAVLMTLRHLLHRRRSWLRRSVVTCLALLAAEEGVTMSFLHGHAKYPHLPIMARFSVCCFVFLSMLLVASYNSFVSSPDEDQEIKSSDKKKIE